MCCLKSLPQDPKLKPFLEWSGLIRSAAWVFCSQSPAPHKSESVQSTSLSSITTNCPNKSSARSTPTNQPNPNSRAHGSSSNSFHKLQQSLDTRLYTIRGVDITHRGSGGIDLCGGIRILVHTLEKQESLEHWNMEV